MGVISTGRGKGRSEGAVVFDVNGADLRVSPVHTTSPTEHTVMGFTVADVNEVVRQLSERNQIGHLYKSFI